MRKTGDKNKPARTRNVRQRNTAKFKIAPDTKIDYKNLTLLQKFINDRGKIVPRRISGITAKNQRQMTLAIKRARFLALLITGGVKKKV